MPRFRVPDYIRTTFAVSVDGQEFGGLFHEGQVFSSPDFTNATDRFDFTIQSGASSTTIS